MSDDFADVVRQISLEAWRKNRRRATELADLVVAARHNGELSTQSRERAVALAHQLRGSAGTFGHPDAAAAAGRIERLLRAPEPITADARTRLAALADDLRSALENDPSVDH